jgi:hypothetical protein
MTIYKFVEIRRTVFPFIMQRKKKHDRQKKKPGSMTFASVWWENFRQNLYLPVIGFYIQYNKVRLAF